MTSNDFLGIWGQKGIYLDGGDFRHTLGVSWDVKLDIVCDPSCIERGMYRTF